MFLQTLNSNYGQPASTVSGTPRPTNPYSGVYARETRAWLAREEWADYQQRFQPVEQELVDAVMGPELLDQRLGAIRASSQQSNDAASQVERMLMQRYGVTPSAQQSAITDNTRALAAARGEVDAVNNTRTHVYDRNMAALGGGSAPRSDIRAAYEGN